MRSHKLCGKLCRTCQKSGESCHETHRTSRVTSCRSTRYPGRTQTSFATGSPGLLEDDIACLPRQSGNTLAEPERRRFFILATSSPQIWPTIEYRLWTPWRDLPRLAAKAWPIGSDSLTCTAMSRNGAWMHGTQITRALLQTGAPGKAGMRTTECCE